MTLLSPEDKETLYRMAAETPAAFEKLRRILPSEGSSNAPRISNGARRILFKLPRTRFENVPKLLGHPDWPEAARLFRPYVQSRMQLPEKFLPALVSPGPLSGI